MQSHLAQKKKVRGGVDNTSWLVGESPSQGGTTTPTPNPPVNPYDPTQPNPGPGGNDPVTPTREQKYYLSFKDGYVYFGKVWVATNGDKTSITNDNTASAWYRGTYKDIKNVGHPYYTQIDILFTEIANGPNWVPLNDASVSDKKDDSLALLKKHALNTKENEVSNFAIDTKPSKKLTLMIGKVEYISYDPSLGGEPPAVDPTSGSADVSYWDPINNADCLYKPATATEITLETNSGEY